MADNSEVKMQPTLGLTGLTFNAMALIHYEEMIERGVLPAELNDMPNYQRVIDPSRLTIRKMRKGTKVIRNKKQRKSRG